jgi:hypothetical protein
MGDTSTRTERKPKHQALAALFFGQSGNVRVFSERILMGRDIGLAQEHLC